MNPVEQKNITESLAVLAEAESAIRDLYEEFAKTWPEDSEFWLQIAAEEAHHASNIQSMSAVFAAHPDEFQPGRPFKSAGIRFFITGAQAQAARARNRELSKKNALVIAIDYEKSGIEDKPIEIVRTTNAEYLALAREITDETGEHRDMMVQRLAALGG